MRAGTVVLGIGLILVLLSGLGGALAVAAPAGPARLDWPVPAASAVRAAHTVVGARDDLEVASERRSLTLSHVRLLQRAPDGTPVLSSDVAVHLAGTAPLYTARFADPAPPRVVLAGIRRLDLDAAAQLALAAVPGVGAVRAREAVALPSAPGVVRPGVWLAIEAGHALREVIVDADSGQVSVGADLLVRVAGSGKVFRPNPITESGDLELQDDGGADSPELTALLEPVTLLGLDGSGYLRGEFADAHRMATRENQPSLIFDLTRGQPGFDEVSAYYHVDRAQRYVQSLGFTGDHAVRAEPLEVVTDYTTQDQSYYDPVSERLNLGTGGVDDAEDADIVVHEYGHSLEYFILPQFGRSADARALGEAWGDTLAATVPTLSEHPALVDRACLAPWDASAYDPPAPCLRRVDGTGHYPEALAVPREPHVEGEIFSGALHDLFAQPDIGAADGLRLVLESMFLYSTSESFAGAGAALLAADQELTGGAHAATIRRVLLWHGVLADLTPPAADGAVAERVVVDVRNAGGAAVDAVATISAPGAQAVRVHFAAFALDTSSSCPGSLCDGLYVYDRDGNLYAHLGGSRSDLNAPIVPGDEVRVRLVTRAASGSTGFVIDRYDTILPGVIPDGGLGDEADAGAAGAADAATAPDAPPDAPGTTMTPDSGGCAVATGSGGSGWLAVVLALVVAVFRSAARGARWRRRSSRS